MLSGSRLHGPNDASPDMDVTLADFQDRALAALLGSAGEDGGQDTPIPPFALRVHRNSVLAGAIDALASNFPAVVEELGISEFRGAAGDFARRYPPTDPRLIVYGERFPSYLESAGAVSAAALARLDRAWLECFVAADAEPLDPAELIETDAVDWSRLRVAPHPATRWPVADAATMTAWARARGLAFAAPVRESDSAMLLSRPKRKVVPLPISRGSAALLVALAANPSLITAGTLAMSSTPSLDLADAFAQLLAAGALVPAVETGAQR